MSTLDLGVIGNCSIASLIDRNGRHVWHGLGRLDGDPVFNALLGGNDPQAGYRHPADHEDAVALKVKEAAPESLLENLKVVYAVSKGDTAGEIVRYAGENQIDLIVVGHKHRGKLYASMFDSTDVHVIDQAMLPVLVFPET